MANLHRHIQEDPKLCGPACVQMVLGFFAQLGFAPQHEALPDQENFAGARRLYDGLFSEPGEIEGWINQHLGPWQRSGAPLYRIASDLHRDVVWEWVCKSEGRPVVLLTGGGRHWVVGVNAGNSWQIADPERVLGEPLNLPHKPQGGCCTSVYRESASEILTRCQINQSYQYQGQYIAVVPVSLPPVA